MSDDNNEHPSFTYTDARVLEQLKEHIETPNRKLFQLSRLFTRSANSTDEK